MTTVGDDMQLYMRMREDTVRFLSKYAIETVKRNDGDITELIAWMRGMRQPMTRTILETERNELVGRLGESKEEELGISQNVGLTFARGDIIIEVTERRSDERKWLRGSGEVDAAYEGGVRWWGIACEVGADRV